MTSSSSLYGPVNEQNTQSTNSTSLYGGADTPIPTPAGDVVVRGDLIVLSGNILTTATTGNIFPANATTVNLGNAATSVNIGADTGTTTINNNLAVDGSVTGNNADFGNIQIAVVDNQTISTTAGELRLRSTSNAIKLPSVTSIYTDNTSSFALLNQPTTVNAFLAATAVNIGATTGTTNINNNLLTEGTGTFTGNITGPGATLGNVTVGLTDNNTVTTTTGSLNLGASGTNNVNITSGSTAPTVITRNTDVTNTAVRSLALNAQTSLTPAVGFGNTLEYQVEAQPGNTERAGYISVNLTDITPGSEDFSMYFGLMQNGATYDTKMVLDSTGSLALDNDLTIGGNNVNLAQDTGFLYNENNDRTMRPYVQSTSGNSSGFRVRAPNATTSAAASLSVGNTNDASNTTFMSMQALGSATDPLRITTGKYTANVFGPSGTSVAFRDYLTTYATVNPSGPTIGTDLTTKTYVDAQIGTVPTYTTNVAPATGGVELDLQQIIGTGISIVGSTKFLGGTNITVSETAPNEITIDGTDLNTTYTINASSTSGGANFNLAGSDATTDTIKIASGTGITVAQTDANTITVNSNITQYTDAQARASISATGSLSYNSTTGVMSYTTPTTIASLSNHTTDDLAEGSTNLYFSNSLARNAISATGDISYNSTTGVISYTAPAAPVTSVNGKTGAVTLTTTDIAQGTNLYYTDAAARAAISGGTGISYNSTTGVITNSGVTSAVAGTGIGVSAGTGAVTISNTGVTSLAASTYLSVNASTGAVTVSTNATDANTASTLVARDASGNFSAGTITANLANASKVLGQLVVTPTLAYTPPGSALTTVTGINGLAIASSTNNTASLGIRYSSGDTSAGTNSSAAILTGGSGGTSTSPSGNAINAVMGTWNFDGYTAGTSNGWAAQIATAQSGAGINAINPLQFQGYARQAFTNSTTVTTAVTGASGTGSVATLTFATQNTNPYQLGQTITVAGMTPSGYNGTYVITAATTSSISYANTTTGFTTGGTIGAANTVTAAGMGYRIRGFANSTNMSVANRFNFVDHTASAATFKADSYAFADSIITGSTLTSTNLMSLSSSGVLFRSAPTTAYASISPGSAQFTVSGINQMIRQGTTNTTQPALLVRYQRTDTTGSNDGDGVDFRLSTAGTTTTDNIARFDAQYRASGFHTVGISVSTDSFTADTDTIYRGQADKTAIRATPTGTTGTASDILTIESSKITAAAPIKFPTYTKAQANALTGAVGWQISISDSASGGNPNGMMAFWDTSNARWSYIHDNTAV